MGMKKEVWKSIPGFRYHEASTLGRIRSLNRIVSRDGRTLCISGMLRKLYKGQRDYMGLRIYKEASKKRITIRVHVLVALTFLGPRPKGLQVAHLNGNGSDNRLENLKYMTPKENTSHRPIHG